LETSRKTNRIIRSNLSEQAAQKIRAWILSLQLRPGERLIVDNLAEELETSRTPIREGLQKLVAEGLVVYDGRSYTVMEFSKLDIENLFEIRCALEVLATRQASVRMSDTQLEALRGWYEIWRTHQQEHDIESFIAQDRRFHQLIYERAGNSQLQSLLDKLNEQWWWIIRIIYAPRITAYDREFPMEEHQAILKCIENRDSDGAADAMEQHLQRSEIEMLQYLE
jgi:DNA-binding GntR family transcriptional regulator